ncbi:unnamed protein product [Closterium sp. Yama58-4]|nr:unnamed protein product [Closterium sp. Yama58-4]
MSSGGTDLMVLYQWTIGVPCRTHDANPLPLSGLLPWRQHGPFSFHLPPSSASAAALSFPPQGVALHLLLLEGSGADSGGTSSGFVSGPAAAYVTSVPGAASVSVPGGTSALGDFSLSAKAAAVVEDGALTSAAAAVGSIDVDLVTVAPRGTAASAPPSFSYSRLNSSPLLTSGSARLLPSSLRLTPLSPPHQAGLALHPTPFPLVSPATPTSPCRPYSFSSSFSFRLSSTNPAALGADGFAFVLLPDPTVGLPGPNMGYGRRPYRQEEAPLDPGGGGSDGGGGEFCVEDENGIITCTPMDSGGGITLNSSLPHLHSLAVEFDTSSTRLFLDPTVQHVGINVDYSMTGEGEAVLVHVGFAAGTGLLPLHTQTHDILSWSFQVDTKAPAPLPIWQPPSLSLPFLTPAAPFTASGTYTSTCSCPLSQPSYKLPQMPAFQTCHNEFPVCRLNSTDTCAPGVCLEGYDATSFCLCPPSFFPLDYSNLLRRPCNPVSKSAVRVPFFPAPPGLTCPLLLDIFDLSPQELLESNKGLACHKPDDTCASINKLMGTNVTDLNRNINCSQLIIPGKRVCVENNARYPSSPVAACNLYKTLDSTVHTCQKLATLRPGRHIMSIAKLFRVNPALYCDHLLPAAAGWTDSVVDKVCLLADELSGYGGMQCVTKRLYLVRRGDTCGKLIASRYKRKVDLFRSLNGGFDCTVSSLWVGMQLCLP